MCYYTFKKKLAKIITLLISLDRSLTKYFLWQDLIQYIIISFFLVFLASPAAGEVFEGL